LTKSWGTFTSFKGTTIEIAAPDFTEVVKKLTGGKDLTACFQCTKCTAGCPVTEKVSIQVHEIMRMLLLGMKEVLETDMIWRCTSCYTCQERCPQGIDVTDILIGLKNLAYEDGIGPDAYRENAKSVLESGFAYQTSGFRRKKRDAKGLPALPEANMAEVEKLAELTGLKALLEEDEAK
jgi:heterodisulfide reductase subunit C